MSYKEVEHPLLRNEVIDPLYNMLKNVIDHFLKKHRDVTNEELDVILNRMVAFHRQQEIHMYAFYIWDLKKEEERLEKLKKEKHDFIR